MNFARVRHYTSLALGRAAPENIGQRRYARLVQALLTAVLGKGFALLVSFVSVPLTVGYLGAERYGLWMTISTLLVWLTLADLGLGSSFTNAVAEAYAHDDRDAIRRYLTTAFVLLCAIVLILALVLLSIWPFINWAALLNVSYPGAQGELGLAVGLAVALFLLNFPLTIVSKLLAALQEGALANYWAAGAQLLTLLSLVIVTRSAGGLPWLVVATLGSVLLINLLSAAWLFGWHTPWLRPSPKAFDRTSLGRLGRIGGMFFVVQVASLLLFQTDNLIITRILGPGEVTPYSVTLRLFSVAIMLQTLMVPAILPAYAEAFALNDAEWIGRTFRLHVVLGLAVTISLIVPLVVFGQQLILLWAGEQATPTMSLLIWMGIWSVINASMSAVGCILSASGRIQGQMIYAMLTAVANIILSVLLIQFFGVAGVMAATVIAYLVFNVVPAICETIVILMRVHRAAEGLAQSAVQGS
jgi:O-antigen/teichoic acid export membrane protein